MSVDLPKAPAGVVISQPDSWCAEPVKDGESRRLHFYTIKV